jgi:PilZ domain
MEPSERRQFERVPQGGRVVGRATVMTEFRVVSLSETGAALETGLPMALGSSCDLALNLSEGVVDIRGRVRDVESVSGNERGPFRVNVDFENVDDGDRALLRFFLEREAQRT